MWSVRSSTAFDGPTCIIRRVAGRVMTCFAESSLRQRRRRLVRRLQ
ncbi:unnamed protein product [Ectocarpus sp. 13 AM-2016]